MNAVELMHLHLEALYLHDAQGRMRGLNRRSGGAAPRLHLGRTGAGSVLRFRSDVDADLAAELTHIWETSMRGADAVSTLERPACADALVRALAACGRVERIWAGPAYAAHGELPALGGETVAIDAAHADLLRGSLEAWLPDVPYEQPFLASIEQGRARAVCASVRSTGAAHEAGVETVPDARRRGHASRAVAAWIDAVRARGIVPLYSTSWDNVASRTVAARLGLRQFGVDFHVT